MGYREVRMTTLKEVFENARIAEKVGISLKKKRKVYLERAKEKYRESCRGCVFLKHNKPGYSCSRPKRVYLDEDMKNISCSENNFIYKLIKIEEVE